MDHSRQYIKPCCILLKIKNILFQNSQKSVLTLEQQFSVWCWDVAQNLSLHLLTRNSEDVPSLNNDPRLYPILRAIKDGLGLANFIGLVMTQHSHR